MKRAGWLVGSVICTSAAFTLATPDVLAATCRTRMTLAKAGEFTCTVPANAVSVAFTAIGAAGGQSFGIEAGGTGDRVQASFAIGSRDPAAVHQALYFEVGGDGSPFAPGANGGGAPNGGGASDVRTAPAKAGLFPDPRLLVAGGGGGAGEDSHCGHCGSYGGGGGNAGFPTAAAGGLSCAVFAPTVCSSGGGGGSQSAGGAAGSGLAAAGTRGHGGGGDSGGGGGGGGYFGGGGGGGSTAGGGGGGGSDYVRSGATSLSVSPNPTVGVVPKPSISVSFVLAGAYATAQLDRMTARGIALVRLICRPDNTAACTGAVRLTYGGKRTGLGTGTFTIAAAGSRRISVALSSSAQTLVRRQGRLAVHAIVSSRGPDGSQLEQLSTVTLIAPTVRALLAR